MRRIYEMSIAFQAPFFFGSGTGLISESSGTASQRQCHQERPSLRLQKHSKDFFYKHPAPYTFVMSGGEKSIGKALLLDGFFSY